METFVVFIYTIFFLFPYAIVCVYIYWLSYNSAPITAETLEWILPFLCSLISVIYFLSLSVFVSIILNNKS